jgi:hypothetical protein
MNVEGEVGNARSAQLQQESNDGNGVPEEIRCIARKSLGGFFER